MSHITIKKSAAGKLSSDPEFRRWCEGKSDKAPVLSYYRRSYSTLHDGTVIEHGDGFMLSFVDPKEVRETGDVTYETVALADGVDILVGGTRSILSEDFTIGWSNAKFTLEHPN